MFITYCLISRSRSQIFCISHLSPQPWNRFPIKVSIKDLIWDRMVLFGHYFHFCNTRISGRFNKVFSNSKIVQNVNIDLHDYCYFFTFLIAFDLDTPGIPLSDFDFFPRTWCFCRLIFTSKGLIFFSTSFFLALTLSDTCFFFFLLYLAIVLMLVFGNQNRDCQAYACVKKIEDLLP